MCKVVKCASCAYVVEFDPCSDCGWTGMPGMSLEIPCNAAVETTVASCAECPTARSR